MGVRRLVKQQSFMFKLIFALSVLGLLLALVMANGAAAPAEAAYNPAPGPEFSAVADSAQAYLTSLGGFLPAGDATPATIGAQELFALMDTDHNGVLGSPGDDYRKAPTIIDVRDATSYSNGHVAGAINIPYQQVGQQANLDKINAEIAKRDNNLVVVYCVTGHTEQVSTMVLGTLGYKAKGLKWGMLSWAGGTAPTYNNSNAVSTAPTAATANNPYPTIAAGTTVQKAANDGAVATNGAGYTVAASDNASTKTFVDLRSASDYNAAHVPGAINIDWQQMFARDTASGAYPNLEKLPRSKQIVVYGNTQHEANMVATGLNMLGYKSTSVTPASVLGMRYGFGSWNKTYGEKFFDEHNHYPVVTGTSAGGYVPAPLNVTSTTPAAGAVDVAADVTVEAVFSSAVDQNTLSSANFYLKNASGSAVSASLSYDSASKTAKLDPVTDLAEGQTYTATVSKNVKGASGEVMSADKSWSFTTAAVVPPPPPPPPPVDAVSVTVMTGGPVSGTQLVDLSIDGGGVATLGAVETITGGQATHGGYLAPSGNKIYINGFTGGGMQVWEKAAGAWSLTKTVPSTIAKMMCSTDLKTGAENPETGMLQVGDISTGFNFDFNMDTDDWKAKSPVGDIELGTFQGVATTCDTAYTENPATGIGWSSGHSNNVYTWDFNTPLPLPVDPASLGIGLPDIPTLKNIRPAETVLGHQNRTFTSTNGTEYIAIFDGSAGQILILNPDDTEYGRITIGGEAHSMGLMVDGVASNKLTSPYAVSANFAAGSLKVIRLVKADGTPNVDGDSQQKPVVTSEVAGVGSAADLCGIDIVNVDGAWMRN